MFALGVGKSLGQGGAWTEGTATLSGGSPHVVEGLRAVVDDRHDVWIVVLQQNPRVKATYRERERGDTETDGRERERKLENFTFNLQGV